MGKEASRAERTRGTHCKGVGGFFHVSFVPFLFLKKKIKKENHT